MTGFIEPDNILHRLVPGPRLGGLFTVQDPKRKSLHSFEGFLSMSKPPIIWRFYPLSQSIYPIRPPLGFKNIVNNSGRLASRPTPLHSFITYALSPSFHRCWCVEPSLEDPCPSHRVGKDHPLRGIEDDLARPFLGIH